MRVACLLIALLVQSPAIAGAQRTSSEVEARVRAMLAEGRYQKAEAIAREFNDRHESSGELWNELGEILHERGRRDEARTAFQRALERGASDSLRAKLNLAIIELESGEVDSAYRHFEAFIDIYNAAGGLSSDELAVVARAVRYLGSRDPRLFKDALRAYDEALQADSSNEQALAELGELFLDKYNSTEAHATFNQLLQLNPRNARALLGKARSIRFDGRPGSIELAERALKTNPNLVPAHVFLAELYLELEAFEKSRQEVSRALAVNPNSLEALSVSAALYYMMGEDSAFRQEVSRIRELNPRYSGLYATLAVSASRNRRYSEARGFAAQALAIDSFNWQARAELGRNQLRLGDIDAGRKTLEQAFRGDPYDVWTKNTLDLLDTFTHYASRRSSHFEFFLDEKEADVLTLYMEPLAEEAFQKLRERYGYTPETPIRVEAYPRNADFSVRTVGLVGLGALGVSFGPVVAMDSPSARPVGDFNWGSTLWHEIAHSFHLGMSKHRVPRWFSEGLAVYEERRARAGWGDDLTPGFLAAYNHGLLLPVSRLNEGFMTPRYPRQVIHSYYLASLVMQFIEEQYGAGAINGMLRAYGRGVPNAGVFEQVLGVSLEEFDARFAGYLDDLLGPAAAVIKLPDPSGKGEPLSPDDVARNAASDPNDFVAQLGMGRILFDQGRKAEARRYLEQAMRLLPGYAGDDSPHWYLALIALDQDDLTGAATHLEAMTNVNERNYAALVKLADVYEQLGDRKRMAGVLARAAYVNPLDIGLHRRLAAVYESGKQWVPAVRERRAVVGLIPVDRAQALYELARAYFGAGDLDRAGRTVIMALEIAPSFEEAQNLLLEIHEGKVGS